MRCPACGSDAAPEARFCRACGTRIESAAAAPPPSLQRYCPTCGSPARAGVRFCAKCGRTLPGESAQSPAPAVTAPATDDDTTVILPTSPRRPVDPPPATDSTPPSRPIAPIGRAALLYGALGLAAVAVAAGAGYWVFLKPAAESPPPLAAAPAAPAPQAEPAPSPPPAAEAPPSPAPPPQFAPAPAPAAAPPPPPPVEVAQSAPDLPPQVIAPGAAANPSAGELWSPIPPSGPAVGPRGGRQVYREACIQCHGNAPGSSLRLDDAVAWTPRLAAGRAALYGIVIDGRGGLHPPVDKLHYSSAELRAGVDYMVAQADRAVALAKRRRQREDARFPATLAPRDAAPGIPGVPVVPQAVPPEAPRNEPFKFN